MEKHAFAFDAGRFSKAIQAGMGPAIFEKLRREEGIVFKDEPDMRWIDPRVRDMTLDMAMDVQSELALQASSGIPAYLATFFDPALIPAVVSPMMAAVIAGERLVGDWLIEVAQFNVGEAVGDTSAYGDYSMNGASNVNTNYPTRQNFLFQSFLQVGDRESGRMGLTKINWLSEQQGANILTLMKALNYMYFYGVAGLENYGLINDPSLYSSIAPTFSWLTNSSATANTIYQDFVRLFQQLQAQSNGVVQMDVPLVVALSPLNAVALKTVTQYNTNSVEALLKQNFPNLRIEVAVQYNTPAGQLVQMIAENIEGVRTVECAFSSKLMAHRMVQLDSSVRQKRSSGGYGTIWRRPFLVSSMLG